MKIHVTHHALPIEVEAVQYDGRYQGPSMKVIEAALARWFAGPDGEPDEDDARSYLGCVTDSGGWAPVLHLRADDDDSGVTLTKGVWIVFDGRVLSVMKDDTFHVRYGALVVA